MPCPDLQHLARNALDAVAARLGVQERTRLAAAGALEKLQFRYTHADSALFAAMVAAITGWPVVGVTTHAGQMHYLTLVPGEPAGQLVDVTGIVCEAHPELRGGTNLKMDPTAPLRPGEDDDRLAVLQLLAQLDYAPYNSVAFQRQLLVFCAAQAIPDQQMPPPVTFAQFEEAAEGNDALTASRFLAAVRGLPDLGWLQRCGAIAADKNNADFIKVLLDVTDIALAFADYGHSWLHVAVRSGAMATVQLLLGHPCSAHLINMGSTVGGWTPLHEAADRANTEMAAVLIAAGADVDAGRAKASETPLHTCLRRRHMDGKDAAQIDMTKLLLAHGADPLLFDKHGAAALHCAAKAGLVGAVQLLVDHGVPVDHTAPDNGVPPIFVAVTTAYADLVDALRAMGANTSAYSRDGDTLLTYCILYGFGPGRPGMIQHLLEVVGLDPDQPNLRGQTPAALAMGRHEIQQALNAFRARRALAGALATAGHDASPHRGGHDLRINHAKP